MFSTKVGPRRAAPGLNRQPARLRGKAVLATLSVLAPLLLLPALNSAAAPSAPTATPSIVVTADQVGSGFDDGWVDVGNRLVWVWPACRARLEDAGMAIRTVSTDELAAATFGPGRSCAKLLKLVPPVPTTTEPPTTAPPAPPTTPEPPAPEPPAPQPPAPEPPAPQPPAPEPPAPTGGWAFEETFDGDPAAPSQILLPDTFDYVVTHRTHPKAHFEPFAPFPADHGPDCAGPNPDVVPLPQHDVTTSHLSRLDEPDQSFFICKNHMMSAMGDVEGYSVSAFWPRQEFDFADGGVLEFDVNINAGHPRSWFEVMLTPRDQLRLGSANEWLPIDETYPADRIVLRLFHDERQVEVGTGAIDPNGVLAEQHDFGWQNRYPDDPATTDRRIRRTMRVQLTDSAVIWAIEREDGSFDEYRTDVPGGLPFDRGLVVFKTHAYTPTKDGNTNVYTFHWDNIRFDGPKLTPYRRSEANDVVYLQANGDRQVGESQTVTIDLSETGPDPVLVGQVHSPLQGQVLLSINGGPNQPIHPPEYTTSDCTSSGWKTFQSPLDPAQLEVGTNTLTWTIGPRPPCAQSWLWDGFSVKALHIQTGG